MATGRMTDRGWVETTRIGDMEFRYRTGRDVPKGASVFDMSVGEITFENLGDRPVNVRYSVNDAFFEGHVFELGAEQELEWRYPRAEFASPDDVIDFDCPPGKKGLLSRQDYLHVLNEIGMPSMLDGTMRTRYAATVLVDGQPHALEFGPHVFHVELDRDWDDEKARYVDYFVARDRGQIPL
jgi:hypothetical protein